MRDIFNESMFGEEHILLQRLRFMNYLWIYCIKIARRRFHYLSEKGRFRNRTWWIKNDLEKWNTIVVTILLAKALSLLSGKLCASEWSNLFLYGIHVLQNQSEFIIYILITFLMIFYSLIYLNNLISNSCINRFEF